VARFANPLFGVSMRIEHWTHAVEQAAAAAECLLAAPGAAKPYAPAPFVWSDQYDLKLQSAGWMLPGDETRVVHGSLAERRCVVLHGREGRLVGAVALNRVRQLLSYRRMIREAPHVGPPSRRQAARGQSGDRRPLADGGLSTASVARASPLPLAASGGGASNRRRCSRRAR
jgi:hypothetical protein